MTSADLAVTPWGPEPPPDSDEGDRTIPASVPAERAVLGALLHGVQLDHEDALSPEDFWRPAHQVIFDAVRAVGGRGELVDAVTVAEELTRREQLLSVGGGVYLHTLLEAAPPGPGVGWHVDIIAGYAVRRRLREAAIYAQQIAEHPGAVDTVGQLVDLARARLDQVSASIEAHDEHGGRGAYLDDLIQERTLEYEQPRPLAVKTGFTDLDELLAGGTGLLPGQLVVVGARTGVGKSLTVGNLATNAARAGWGVAMFSLEMPRREVTDRVLAATAGVPLDRLTAHQLTDWDWSRIRKAREDLAGVPLYVDDRPGMTIQAIRAKCRDLTRDRHGLGLVVVDYLQLVSPENRSVDRRVQVDALSRELKLLAKEFDVPVVASAQLNRNPESRADKTPTLADLRESGSLEQDADIVILGFREGDHPGELSLLLAKQRGGTAGVTVKVAWAASLARLSDLYQPGGVW